MLVEIGFFLFGAAAVGLLGLMVYLWLWGGDERTYTADDLKDYYGTREDDFDKNYYVSVPVETAVKTRRSKRIRSRKSGVRKPVSKKSKKTRRTK